MYSVETEGIYKTIKMPENDSLRYKFYKLDTKKRIKFNRLNDSKTLVAVVSGGLIVKKLPHSHYVHYEIMRNSKRQLSQWGGVEHDTLIENLLECVEIIK